MNFLLRFQLYIKDDKNNWNRNGSELMEIMVYDMIIKMSL